MKRTLSILGLGLACAAAAHFGWYGWRTPVAAQNEGSLAWLKFQFVLSAEQYAQLRALHEQSNPRLRALAENVARMEKEFAAFEKQRETAGEIDFIEFARFVQERRTVEKECHASTRSLVAATAQIMTAEQRDRYLSLVEPALRDSALRAVN